MDPHRGWQAPPSSGYPSQPPQPGYSGAPPASRPSRFGPPHPQLQQPPHPGPHGPPFNQPPSHLGMPPHMPPYPGMPLPGGMPPHLHGAPGMPPGPSLLPHPSHMQPPHLAPAPAASQPLAGKTAADWQSIIDAASGRPYYYNRVTRITTWVKPEELNAPPQSIQAPPSAVPAAASAPSSVSPPSAASLSSPLSSSSSSSGSLSSPAPTCLWKEQPMPDGRPYYYHSITKETTWFMPEEYKQFLAAQEQQKKQAAQPPASQKAPEKPTPSPALPSFSSLAPLPSLTSSLYAPLPSLTSALPSLTSPRNPIAEKDLEDARRSVINAPSASKINISYGELPSLISPISSSSSSSSALSPVERPKSPVYGSKKEATQAFKEMLDSFKIPSDCSWETAMKKIMNDVRYKALKTIGEKKAAFNEYLVQKKKDEQEAKRLSVKKSKDDFITMLTERASGIPSRTPWEKILPLIEPDARFAAVENESVRRELYDDFMTDVGKKEKEAARLARREAEKNFRDLLESDPTLTFESSWREVSKRYEEHESYLNLEKEYRLRVFDDFIRDLERVEEERRMLEKEERRRREKIAREVFRDFLNQQLEEGQLTLETRWKDFVARWQDDLNVREILHMSESSAHDFYYDVLENKQREVRDEAKRMKRTLDDAQFAVELLTPYEEFEATLLTHYRQSSSSSSASRSEEVDENGEPVPIVVDADASAESEAQDASAPRTLNIVGRMAARWLFEELKRKAEDREKERQKEADRKRYKAASRFKDMLRGIVQVTFESTWDQIRPIVAESPEFSAVETEEERIALFDEVIQRLKRRAEEKAAEQSKKRGREAIDGEEEDEGADQQQNNGDDRESKKGRAAEESETAPEEGEVPEEGEI